MQNALKALLFLLAIAGAGSWLGMLWLAPAALAPEELAPAAVAKRLEKSDASRKDKDLKAAAALLLPLAQNGNAEAQFRLGLVYREDEVMALLKGKGHFGSAPEDHETGGEWLLLAAKQGHLDAQAVLGIHYCWGVAGSTVARAASPEGMAWLLKAANAGHVEAQRNLATTYRQGLCVTQDFAEAAKWFLRAAEQNDEWSMVSLSNMSKDGEGVPKDSIQSDVWAILAGLDKNMKRRNSLAPEVRAEVERRMKEWLEKHPGAHHE